MRTRIALAGALLSTVAVVGPLAAAGHGAGPGVVRCADPAEAAVCELLDRAAEQLEPLQAVLAPAGADLGLVGLPALAARPEGVPTPEVLVQATSLRSQISSLPEPVRGAPGVVDLAQSLDDLIAALAAPAGPIVAPASPSRPVPAPRPAPDAPQAARPPSTFGGTATSSSTPSSAPVDRPAIPDVPVGDSLTFAPLALPDFGFDQGFEAAPSELTSGVVDATTELAVPAAADHLPKGSRGPEVLVTVAAVVLLLAAAVALDARKRPPVLPD